MLAGMRQVGRDYEQGHASILVSAPLPRQESLESVLAGLGAGMASTPSPTAQRGAGITAFGQHLAFEQNEGNDGVLDAVVMDDGVRRIALMLRGRALAPSHALLARDVFDAAVRSVRPAPGAAPAAPLVPPEAAGTLYGAFTGLRFDRRPNGEGETDILVKTWILLFDPSGLFSRVVPSAEGGVLAHCRAEPADCGTYSLLGGNWLRRPDRIRLREGSGRYGLVETRELTFARQEETLQIDGTRLNPAAIQPPGTMLEGLWSMLSVSSETAVRRALTLGWDGRFQRSVEENDFGGDITSSSSAGRYDLEGYRLLLESDDGQRESLSLLQPDRDSDGLLFIEGDAYLKRAPDQRIAE